MKPKTLYIILFFVIMLGCQSCNQKPQTSDLPVINLSKNYPQKEIRLQDIADIEYIPLETTDDVLLGQFSMIHHFSENIIAVNDGSDGIVIFNRQGNIISHFNRRGQGPQEYIQNSRFVFDEKNNEIFVSDAATQRLLVYSISGEYKRTLKYSMDDFIAPYVYNFDDETLLLYNFYDVRTSSYYTYSEKPYKLMSKKDFSVVSDIDIQMPVRYTNRIAIEIDVGGQKYFTPASVMMPSNNLYYGHDFLIADISSDTIYLLTKNRELTPMLVRTPSVHSSTSPVVWRIMLPTDKFIILFTTTLDLVALEKNQVIPYNILMYEFETGQTHTVSFVNDDYLVHRLFPRASICAMPKNMFVELVSPTKLITYYEEKLLKGEIEKIPDEEDNPIVVIYKFK